MVELFETVRNILAITSKIKNKKPRGQFVFLYITYDIFFVFCTYCSFRCRSKPYVAKKKKKNIGIKKRKRNKKKVINFVFVVIIDYYCTLHIGIYSSAVEVNDSTLHRTGSGTLTFS